MGIFPRKFDCCVEYHGKYNFHDLESRLPSNWVYIFCGLISSSWLCYYISGCLVGSLLIVPFLFIVLHVYAQWHSKRVLFSHVDF